MTQLFSPFISTYHRCRFVDLSPQNGATAMGAGLIAGIILGVGAAAAYVKYSAPSEKAPAASTSELWISNGLDWDAGQSEPTRHANTGTATRNSPGTDTKVPNP